MPYINPNRVTPRNAPQEWFVRKMVQVLIRQGQIEPLQIKALSMDVYVTFKQDPHGDDIVYAARKLGWDTILVHLTDKYEE